MDGHTVGEAARLAGVSVRTLHHYDEVGLLVPGGRSAGNYRLYSPADMDRLRRIRFYRELDFGLDDIARLLDEPGAHTDDHLRRQHRLLRERLTRTQALLEAVEREMDARAMGLTLSAEEQFEIFGTDRLAQLSARAGTPASRTAAFTPEEWRAIRAEADASIGAFAAAITAGEPPTGAAAMRLAEDHRAHLSRWFGPCSYQRHREVAAEYLAAGDAWDEVAPGFARYVHDAIIANADRQPG